MIPVLMQGEEEILFIKALLRVYKNKISKIKTILSLDLHNSMINFSQDQNKERRGALNHNFRTNVKP